MSNTTYTGKISLLQKQGSPIFPITSAEGVLLNGGTKLTAKLEEIDDSLSKKQDKLTTSDDLLIYLSANSTDYVIQHNNSLGTEVGEETLLLIFDIDNHGHITNCRNATPEDLAKTGTAFLRFVGNYNPKITYSYGDICVINGDVPSDMSLEEGDFIIMGTTGKWSSWQADITPNIQLSNSNSRIYGTGDITKIYAPTELGDPGLVLTTNSAEDGLEWKNIPTTDVEFIQLGNTLTIGDTKISFSGGTGISVNSSDNPGDNTGKNIGITVSSLYSYNKEDFKIDEDKKIISLLNPQEQVTLSAGDGINIKNNTVSVKLDSGSDSYLTVGGEGLKLSGIGEAINAEELARKQADAAFSTRVDSLETIVNPINSGYPYIVEEIWGEDHNYNFENLSRIDKLANNTQAVLKELWGENHNYDWSKSSRIDNLESTVNNLSYIQTIQGDSSIQVTPRGKTVNLTFNENKLQELIPRDYEVFGWDLEFGGGLIPMPHENALWITRETGGYIKLPYPGTYKVTFDCVSSGYNGYDGYIMLNNVSQDNIAQYTTTLFSKLINSTDGYIHVNANPGSAIINMSIKSSKLRDVKTLISNYTYNIEDFNLTTYEIGNLPKGFYTFKFSILGANECNTLCVFSENYDMYSIVTGENFQEYNKKYFNTYSEKHYNVNLYRKSNISVTYYVKDTSTLFKIQSEGLDVLISNFTITRLEFTDIVNSVIDSSTINNSVINNAYNSTINSSTINNPLLSLTSQNSKLYNRVVEFLNKLYIQLVYEVDSKIIWTLDLGGLTMGSSDIPVVTIKEKYYFVRNNPYEINNFSLTSSCQELDIKIEDDKIYESSTEGREGYYISSIAQMNSDGSTTHTLLYYQPNAVLNKIRKTTIILKDGKIQNGIFI